MIRIPPELLKRIDEGARRLGISRSAFIVQSAAEKLERMGS
jgi:predicted transcriptional regulator